MLINKNIALLLLSALAATTPAQAGLSDSLKGLLSRMRSNAIAQQITAKRVGYLALGAGALVTTVGLWFWLKNRANVAKPNFLPQVQQQLEVAPVESSVLAESPESKKEQPKCAISIKRDQAEHRDVRDNMEDTVRSIPSPLPQVQQQPEVFPVESSVLAESPESKKEQPKYAISIKRGQAERRGARRTMEDRLKFGKQNNYFLGAVYDGHGGESVAEILAHGLREGDLPNTPSLSSLRHYIFNNLVEKGMEPDKAIKEAFHDMDDQLRSVLKNCRIMGSTAVGVLIDRATKKAYLFWAGDSRGLHIDASGKVLHVTQDHRADNENEVQRVEKTGATFCERIKYPAYPYAAPEFSRAFGDFPFKPYRQRDEELLNPIIVTPEIISFDLQEGEHLVLACDGVWNVLSNEDVAEIVVSNKQLTPKIITKDTSYDAESKDSFGDDKLFEQIAEQIRDKAFDKGSQDNITAMVISVRKE